MKYINISQPGWNNEYLKPLLIDKNEMILVKIGTDLQNLKSKVSFEGFYKYNLLNGNTRRIDLPSSITYFYVFHYTNSIIYASVSENEKEFIPTFYSIDFSENINKLYTKRLNKFWHDEPYKETAQTLSGRVMAYPIDGNFTLFLEDQINDLEEFYNCLSSLNSYKLFVCKSGNSWITEVYDRTIFQDGIDDIEVFNINEKNYLLLKTGLIDHNNKKGEWNYFKNREYKKEIRGFNESIMLIEADNLTKQIGVNNKKVLYNRVETIGLQGSIYFLKRFDTKLFYGIKDFEENKNQLVCYDLLRKSYKRWSIPEIYDNLVYDNKDIYAQVEEAECINLIGITNNLKIRFPKDIGNYLALIDKKIVVTEQWSGSEEMIKTCILYDVDKKSILETITGKVGVEFFERDQAIVIY